VSESFVPRPRINAAIEASADRRAVLVTAPSGYGTSSTLREYAAAHEPSVYVALPESVSFARFSGELVHALSAHVPGMRLSLAGAYERALQREDPADTLATWFARHVADLSCTIVIDDLHNAGDPLVARFVARAIERSPDSIRWLIASRTLDELPVASWLAHGITNLPIDGSVLLMRDDHLYEFASRLAPSIAPESLAALHASTKGVIADFVFLLRRPATDAAQRFDIPFETAAEEVFAALDGVESEFLLQTALLPALDLPTLGKAAGPEAGQLLAAIRRKAPQIFDFAGTRYQSRFQAFLRTKIEALDDAELQRIVMRSARALEADGDIGGAIHLLAHAKNEGELLRLIERYGFTSVESDKAYFTHDALAALGEEARAANYSVLAVQAIIASLGGKFDVSEALFQHALLSCNVPQQRMRMRYLYAVDLLRRGREDCVDLLKPDEAFFDAPPEVRVAVMSALGAAYVITGRPTEGRKWVDRALASAKRLDDNVLSARVHHQASFVALQAGDGERAKALGKISADLAESEGVLEVAGGAYSVLYNAAKDIDDDLETAAGYLERIAACGAKCGSVDKQLYAWVAAYEIAAERGDARAIAGIERELAEFDVQYSSRHVMQALLPAKALQLGTYGDYARAHKILSSSADNQASDDRRALRLAEIAFYAAAAGENEDAAASVTAAWRLIRRHSSATQDLPVWRARTLCALTFTLLGRIRSPRLILAALRKEIPARCTRSLALVGAAEALVARRAGERNYDAVVDALDELRRRQSGGFARLLEALPSRLVGPLRRSSSGPVVLQLVPELHAIPHHAPVAESA
jgi:ATP/maltotriose-dependent transcriptional regulator MalT